MRITTLLYLCSLSMVEGFMINAPHRVLFKNSKVNLNDKHIVGLKSKNGDEEDETRLDIIEGIGGFMGYPKERKWKGFRIACYSIFAGSILRSALVDVGNYIDNKTNNDALESSTDSAVVLQSKQIGFFKNIQPVKMQKVIILDEPYLCESSKFI